MVWWRSRNQFHHVYDLQAATRDMKSFPLVLILTNQKKHRVYDPCVYEDVRGMLDINSSDLLNSHLIMLDFLTAVCVNKNTPQRPWTHLKTGGGLLNFLENSAVTSRFN